MSSIEGSHGPVELLIYRRIPHRVWLSCVLPNLSQNLVRNIFAVDKLVHDVLMSRVDGVHDNVIDCVRKPGIAYQGKPESLSLLIVMIAFVEGHNRMRAERLQDGRDGVNRHSLLFGVAWLGQH